MFFQSTRVARLGVLAAVGLLVWNSLFFAGGVRIHPAVVSAQADTTTVRFQQGVAPSAAYAGAADTTLSETNKTSTYGSSASVRVDGDDLPGTGLDLSALLSWNISSIPPGSINRLASITVNASNGTANAFPIYALRRAWSERYATWNNAASGVAWGAPGASAPADRGGTVLGTFAVGLGSQTVTLNPDGVGVVQGWVDNPASNFGLIVADTQMDDGLLFASNNSATLASRPMLTVTYHAGGAPTTPTNTATAVPTGTVVPTETAVAATATAVVATATAVPTGTAIPVETETATVTPLPSTAPRYVFLFIGDGMGFEHVKAGSYYATGQAGGLSFEILPLPGPAADLLGQCIHHRFSRERNRYGDRRKGQQRRDQRGAAGRWSRSAHAAGRRKTAWQADRAGHYLVHDRCNPGRVRGARFFPK